MQLRRMTLAATAALLVAGAAASAFAHDEWGWRERKVWREHQWREHAWRERAWREHEWREHRYPPVAITPGYGSYGPPVYYR